jgi:hypothetical protein
MLKKIILPTLFLMFCGIGMSYAADAGEDVMQKCQGKHPEWYQCVTDADCTISLDPCGWPVLGVNKMHKDRSEICTRQAGAFIDCKMWSDDPANKMVAVCQEGVCESIKASEAPVKESKPADDQKGHQ